MDIDRASHGAFRGVMAEDCASDTRKSSDLEIGQVVTHDEGQQHLHRELKARQLTMIAIGGALGTGLIIGTGKTLAQSGPGAILISYSVIGLLVYIVMCALGEVATWLPCEGGFSAHASRFVDPALGFALGWTYWVKYLIATPNQLTAASLVIAYWVPRDKVNPGVFIAVFMIAIVSINYLGIKVFGELEFWLSSIKIVVMIAIILLMLILTCGGVPGTEPIGFRYWKRPGAFAEFASTGTTGEFLAFWNSLVTAVFAFGGIELIGVTVSEAQNPRRNVPRAIKLTFWRICVFYVLSVFLLGLVIPYNSSDLAWATRQSSSAAASPFVVAIQTAGIAYLPDILNGFILVFIFSAANSDLYIASRTIHGLAIRGQAPKFLAMTTNRGVPLYALGVSSSFCLLAFMNVSSDAKEVFSYFVNVASLLFLLTWISILISHIWFVKARVAQNITESQLRYKSPFGLWGSYIALTVCIVIALTKNFSVFVGGFDSKGFITGYREFPHSLTVYAMPNS